MAARPQHQQAGTGRACRGVVQQRGLAQPRRRLDQDRASRPACGTHEHLGDGAPLGIAFQQGLPRHRAVLRPGRHGASVVPVPGRAKPLRRTNAGHWAYEPAQVARAIWGLRRGAARPTIECVPMGHRQQTRHGRQQRQSAEIRTRARSSSRRSIWCRTRHEHHSGPCPTRCPITPGSPHRHAVADDLADALRPTRPARRGALR